MEMIGGLKRTTSHFAIAALASVLVGGVFASPSQAADLGGDCCADLEERVAELEATTVRKGNRNVSVTLYGWVNAGITWYDNGEESDAYVVDTDTAVSRLGVKGSGKIKPGWEAGYRLEMAVPGPAELSFLGENDADDGTNGVRVRHASWWISSEQLGKVTVGQTDGAATGIEGIDLSGPASWISYNGAQDWNFSFSVINNSGNTFLWSDVLDDFDVSRGNFIRYDTPSIAGFTASASWGEDDRYDVALRYSQDWNGLAVEAGVGYSHNSDDTFQADPAKNNPNSAFDDTNEVETFLASLSLYHAATGLFGVASYGEKDANLAGVPNATNWYGKLGWRKNVTGMGETAIYGEYTHSEDVTPGTEGDQWGAGIGQDIDAVGGTLYLGYRHSTADLGPGISAEDQDQVLGGMVLPF